MSYKKLQVKMYTKNPAEYCNAINWFLLVQFFTMKGGKHPPILS